MSISEDRAEWVEFATEEVDLFQSDHCGYWLRGIEHRHGIGWLVRECDPDYAITAKERAADEAAGETFRETGKCESGYMLLDRKAASKAFTIGIKKYGTDSYENGEWDVETYDYILQMALLGEVVYG